MIYPHQVLRVYLELRNLQVFLLNTGSGVDYDTKNGYGLLSFFRRLYLHWTFRLSLWPAKYQQYFKCNPVILTISTCYSREIEDFETPRSKILNLCSLSHLHIFLRHRLVTIRWDRNIWFKPDDVRYFTFFCDLKLDFRFKGNVITLTPDDLYRSYIKHLPLFLSDGALWSFSLGPLFYHTLPLDLQDATVKNGYQLLNLLLLATKFLQATAL